MDKIRARIKEIHKELENFDGLQVAHFGYCETNWDYKIASYFGNSIHACIEVTRDKPKYQNEHRQLVILDSYLTELYNIYKDYPQLERE
mgnify:CR=1 FL=1